MHIPFSYVIFKIYDMKLFRKLYEWETLPCSTFECLWPWNCIIHSTVWRHSRSALTTTEHTWESVENEKSVEKETMENDSDNKELTRAI